MSNTNTHWLNLALNRWNNSRATAKNLTRLNKLDPFRKFYFGLALICISIPCNSDTPVFDLGRFSLDPKSVVPQYLPVAVHLAGAMQEFGFESGNVQIFSSLDQAREAFREGDLDMLTCGIFEAAALMRTGDVIPLAVKWVGDVPERSSLIVVNANSDIFELADLVGKSIGFEDSTSSSAYFIAYKAIADLGLPIFAENIRSSDPGSTIRFRFTGSEQNSSALLYQGKLDAITISDYDWLKPDHMPADRRDDFRVIWTSNLFPRAVGLVRTTMPKAQQSFLKDYLIGLHHGAEARPQEFPDSFYAESNFTALQQKNMEQLEELIRFIDQRVEVQ